MKLGITTIRRLSIVLLLGLVAAFAPEAALASSASADFNGDGLADLAIGVPLEDTPGYLGATVPNAGAVNVLYGTSTGLVGYGDWFHQDSPGVLDQAEAGDLFGSAVAAGDFNGDGFADLAVGVPREDFGVFIPDVGAVAVFYGTPWGLRTTGNQLWHQNSADSAGSIADLAEPYDSFGASLAAADFGNGSQADLAVGAPRETVGAVYHAGAINVIYGSAAGLNAAGNQFWHQDSAGIEETAEAAQSFGHTLAAANFGKSIQADLAVGVPYESVGALHAAGAVNVLYGSADGLTAAGNQLWHQDSAVIYDVAEQGDAFGYALAAADLDKSGEADLAVGVPQEDVGAAGSAGAVAVFYGGAGGLAANGNQFWHQDSSGIEDAAEQDDGFGFALAAADFGEGDEADLAITANGENSSAGAVSVLYGDEDGLSESDDQFWHQDSPGVSDAAESGDYFGYALLAANFGKSAEADLAVGVPYEDVGLAVNAGAVAVLYGGESGLGADGDQDDQFLYQGLPGVKDVAESYDEFGVTLP